MRVIEMTAIIVQARMSSTRLPGKVLLEVNGKPLLEYQIERLKRCREADRVIIATTVNPSDSPIVDLCERMECDYIRGPEDDVLSRYRMAADKFGAGIVVRVTSDCPLIDPVIIDKVISFYKNKRDAFDYVSNSIKRTYPRGMDCEVFSTKCLEQIDSEAASPHEREHVTPAIYNNPGRFKLGSVVNEMDLSNHRWTVDTKEDFELIRRILSTLYLDKPEFTMADCVGLIAEHPDWMAINSSVEQKGVKP